MTTLTAMTPRAVVLDVGQIVQDSEVAIAHLLVELVVGPRITSHAKPKNSIVRMRK